MNICASYIFLKEWDKAIDAGKKAVQNSDSSIEAKANFNLGLAYFNKAAEGDNTKVSEAEPYFSKVAKLMPQYSQTYYYLGLIEESARPSSSKALELYEKGCQLNWADACGRKIELERKIFAEKTQAERTAKQARDKQDEERRNTEREAQRRNEAAAAAAAAQPTEPPVSLAEKVKVPKSESAQYDEYESNLVNVRNLKPEKARKQANKDWTSLDRQTDPSMRKAYIENYLKLSRTKP